VLKTLIAVLEGKYQDISERSQEVSFSMICLKGRNMLEENRLNPSKSSLTTFLLGVGIPVKMDPEHSTAHHKVMAIDGGKAIIGPFDFTKAAEENNSENPLVIHDKRLASLCTKNWQEHAERSEVCDGRGRWKVSREARKNKGGQWRK
jgi:phosphatidylserine/phosphatidylglycerophosphate/cardiolipin synthase-like enzyme